VLKIGHSEVGMEFNKCNYY